MIVLLTFWLRGSKPVMGRYVLIKDSPKQKNSKAKDKIVDGCQIGPFFFLSVNIIDSYT